MTAVDAKQRRLAIVNERTGEIVHFSSDAGAVHPPWVHKQICTTGEPDLRSVLAAYSSLVFHREGVAGADALGIFIDTIKPGDRS
jgi:hypothetical protein